MNDEKQAETTEKSVMSNEISAEKKTMGQGAKMLVDLGPVIVFMLFFNFGKKFFGDDILYVATGVFMIATLVALSYALLVEKRVPVMLGVTAVIVLFFGGLTIYLQSPLFILYKPTIINMFWAVLIFGGLGLGHNIWKLILGEVFELPDEAWQTFAIRWGLFFIFLAILNEVVWRSTAILPGSSWFELAPETNAQPQFWVNFKVFGVMPLTFLFTMTQLPLLMKYNKEMAAYTGKDET